jgi:amidophosphoribosyltransferase
VSEIQELIGADRLIYQDLHGLIRSVRHDNSDITEFDTSCFSGHYVTDDVTDEYLRNLEAARSDEAKSERDVRLNDIDGELDFIEEAEEAEDAAEDAVVGM